MTEQNSIEQITIEGDIKESIDKSKCRTAEAKQLKSTETKEKTIESSNKKSRMDSKKVSLVKKRTIRKKKTRGTDLQHYLFVANKLF